jgi:methanogenic corrinoid protein MtbC1
MSDELKQVIGTARASVLRAVQSEGRPVSEIVAATGLSQSNVSNHLGRLREQGLVAARREGRRVIYTIQNPDLVRALLASNGGAELPRDEQVETRQRLAREFEEAVRGLDYARARSLINLALSDGLPWQDIYIHVFQPLLARMGAEWEQGLLTISEEHAAAQLVERMMGHIASLRVPAPNGRCQAVVACAQGEMHQIGPRMVSDMLAAEGWSCVFLGANVPNQALLDYVDRYRPAVVAVSAGTVERVPALRDLVRQFRERFPEDPPRLLLGGRLFDTQPETYAELGLEPVALSLDSLVKALRVTG